MLQRQEPWQVLLSSIAHAVDVLGVCQTNASKLHAVGGTRNDRLVTCMHTHLPRTTSSTLCLLEVAKVHVVGQSGDGIQHLAQTAEQDQYRSMAALACITVMAMLLQDA